MTEENDYEDIVELGVRIKVMELHLKLIYETIREVLVSIAKLEEKHV